MKAFFAAVFLIVPAIAFAVFAAPYSVFFALAGAVIWLFTALIMIGLLSSDAALRRPAPESKKWKLKGRSVRLTDC